MGPSPFWAHIGWGNAEPGEVSSEQTLVEVRTGSLPLSCYVCFCLSNIALLLALSFAHTDGRKMHCLADRVSWIGTLSSSSISPRWSTLWPAQREREVVSGGDDETLLARHTPQLTPNRRLDCSSPQTWSDVLLMLMASPVSQLSCRDSLRLRLTRTDRALKNVAEAEQFKFCFVVTVFNIFTWLNFNIKLIKLID